MNKKIFSALMIAIAITSISFANGDSTKVNKNEIGLNVAPFAVVMLGGAIFEPKFSLSYKRLIKEKYALRFSVSYLIKNNSFSISNEPEAMDKYEYLSGNDSVQLRRYFVYNPGNKIQLNTGIEYRWGKKKLTQFVGGDLTFGYFHSSDVWKDVEYLFGIAVQEMENDKRWFQNMDKEVSIARSVQTDAFYVGLSPVYGIRYDISKKFSLSAQTGFDFLIGKQYTQYDSYLDNVHENYKSFIGEFNISGLISDLSLIYKF